MNEFEMKDLIKRTNEELYIGVVGPVRSGKSTFIRKFCEVKILPYLKNDPNYSKFVDELPQSGAGKQITTVEPKFIPSTTTKISIEENVSFFVRLVDSVGYIIKDATGYLNEDGTARLVQTPWYEEQMPFHDAATLGTKKIIEDHSNIGIVLTSDGSFGDFSREEYKMIEGQIINELKELKKPFVIVLNTAIPTSPKTIELTKEINDLYGVSTIAVDVNNLTKEEADNILKLSLNEFDISEIVLHTPNWLNVLEDNNTVKKTFLQKMKDVTLNYHKLKDVFALEESLKENENTLFTSVSVTNIDPATGIIEINIELDEESYNKAVEEILGEKLDDKAKLLTIFQNYKKAQEVSSFLKTPLEEAKAKGYSIAVPEVKEMRFDTPTVIKQGNRYGIQVKAYAKAILLNEVLIESVFDPIIGSEQQAVSLIDSMKENGDFNMEKLMELEVFGRSLKQVIREGIMLKVNSLEDDILVKFNESIGKVINYNKGGVICLLV